MLMHLNVRLNKIVGDICFGHFDVVGSNLMKPLRMKILEHAPENVGGNFEICKIQIVNNELTTL